MAKKMWIQGAIKHPGALTKKAKAHHMSVNQFEGKVKAHPEKYSTQTKRQVNLAKTLASFRNKK